MNFSVIFNTRKRDNILRGCLESFLKKAHQPELVEFLARVDSDDVSTIAKCNELKQQFPNFHFCVGDRPKSLNESVSELAFKAKGTFVYGVNDDIYMLTDYWDAKILYNVEQFKSENNIKDNIIYVKTNCTSVDRDQSKGYASCPLISKEAIQVFNMYLPPNFVGLGADSAIYLVYNKIGRVVDSTEVIVDHLYHNTLEKVIHCDETSREMRANTYSNQAREQEFNVDKYVEIFNKYIHE